MLWNSFTALGHYLARQLADALWAGAVLLCWVDLLPGCPGTRELSSVLRRRSCEREVVKRQLPRACDRWQKFCPSPLLLITDENTPETVFRL